MLIKEENFTQRKVNIYKELQNKKIIVPFFQREYVWNKEELEDFLNDIILKIEEHENDKKIYLLRFIFSKTKEENLYIIDGQQRLISLNLFIKKIIDYANKKNINVEIKEFNIKSDDDNEIQSKSLKKNSDYFVNWIEEKLNNDNENNKLKKIIQILKEDIIIDYLETISIDESFEIFNLLNSGGKKLTSQEIIISQFKKLIKEEKNNPFNLEMLKDNEKKIEKYCSAYYFLKKKSSRFKFKIEEIKILFKDFKKDKKEFKSFSESLVKIKKQEQNHKIIINIIQNINRPQLLQIFYIIVFNEKKILEYHKLFFKLFLLSILMSFEKKNPGGIIINLYCEISKKICNNEKIEKVNEVFSNFIKKHEEFSIFFNKFLEYLGSSKEIKIKRSLFLINFLQKNNNLGSESDFEIEHMIPQKNRDMDIIYETFSTDSVEIRELTENIGNFILINSDTNKKLSNKLIENKIEIYKNFFNTNFAYNIDMNMLDYNRLKNELLKEYISERQKKIAEFIYKFFPLANMMIKKN